MLSRTKQRSAYCGRHCALYVSPLESPQYLSINSHHLRLAPVIVISSMFFSLSIYCNRHNRRANLATAQQTRRGSRATYGRNPHDPGSAGGLAPPQYPPPAHNPFDDPYIYDPTTGFAPVREVSVSSLQLFLLIPPTPPSLSCSLPPRRHSTICLRLASPRSYQTRRVPYDGFEGCKV